MITAKGSQNKLRESLELSLKVLGMLGIRFPKKPAPRHLKPSLAHIERHLTPEGIRSLSNLPPMTDPHRIAAMRLLIGMTISAMTLDSSLHVLAVVKRFQITTEHGFVRESIPTFATMGSVLCGVFNRIEEGVSLCLTAIDIAEKKNLGSAKLSASMYYCANVSFWKEHLNIRMSRLIELYHELYHIGHIQPASLCLTYYAGILYTGKNLEELDKIFAANMKKLSRMGFPYGIIMYQLYMQQIKNLSGGAENPARIAGDVFNLEALLPLLKDIGVSIFIALAHLHEIIAAYTFEDFEYAEKASAKAEEYLEFTREIHVYPLVLYYISLALIAVYPGKDSDGKKAILRKVRGYQKQTAFWSGYCPMNVLHRYHLVEAELARILGRHEEAADLYDLAAEEALENGYTQDAALSNELAAKFWNGKGKKKFARPYMENAIYNYSRWGAKAKVDHLLKFHGDLAGGKDSWSKTAGQVVGFGGGMSSLDMETMVKISQALSVEIDLGRLLERIMVLSTENAGASKGFLILESEADGNLYVEAESGPEIGVRVLERTALAAHGGISFAIANYVARTRDILILNNAVAEGAFINDPYVMARRPKSVLCMPVIRQAKLVGLLYFENSLAIGAFTAQRVEVLSLLSSQAAISIENARLYENVRKAREHVKTLLETANEGFWHIDRRGVTLDVNQEMCTILGRSREDVIGHSIFEFGDDENVAIAKSSSVTLKNEGKCVYEAAVTRPDGSKVDCLFKSTLVRDSENGGSFAMVTDITERKRAEAAVRTMNAELEKRVMERTRELNLTLAKVEKANAHILESIRYAKMIQQSVLPSLVQIKEWIPESFFIWEPRDIIGGDFFYAENTGKGTVLAVVDCTGHGVPGAFMTMIAASGLRRVIRDEGLTSPALILKRLNAIVKTSLHQDTAHALSDDGLDAGICYLDKAENLLTYAGARIPLVHVSKGALSIIPADRQSIGYAGSDLDFTYTEHRIPMTGDHTFYMFTDGFTDQLGGSKNRRFGRKNLYAILQANSGRPFYDQRDILLREFNAFKGDNDRQDDMTMVGFRPSG
jgi:PAS domain S-box-containing protein